MGNPFVNPVAHMTGNAYTRSMLKERRIEIWGPRVKRLRLHLGLSQVEMAKLIDSSRTSVANWETGKKAPDEEFRDKIASLEAEYGLNGKGLPYLS